MSVNHGNRNHGNWGLVRQIGPWKPTARDKVGANGESIGDNHRFIRPGRIVGNKPHSKLSVWGQRSVIQKPYDIQMKKSVIGRMNNDSTPAILKGIQKTLKGLADRGYTGVDNGRGPAPPGAPGNDGGAGDPNFQPPGIGPADQAPPADGFDLPNNNGGGDGNDGDGNDGGVGYGDGLLAAVGGNWWNNISTWFSRGNEVVSNPSRRTSSPNTEFINELVELSGQPREEIDQWLNEDQNGQNPQQENLPAYKNPPSYTSSRRPTIPVPGVFTPQASLGQRSAAPSSSYFGVWPPQASLGRRSAAPSYSSSPSVVFPNNFGGVAPAPGVFPPQQAPSTPIVDVNQDLINALYEEVDSLRSDLQDTQKQASDQRYKDLIDILNQLDYPTEPLLAAINRGNFQHVNDLIDEARDLVRMRNQPRPVEVRHFPTMTDTSPKRGSSPRRYIFGTPKGGGLGRQKKTKTVEEELAPLPPKPHNTYGLFSDNEKGSSEKEVSPKEGGNTFGLKINASDSEPGPSNRRSTRSANTFSYTENVPGEEDSVSPTKSDASGAAFDPKGKGSERYFKKQGG